MEPLDTPYGLEEHLNALCKQAPQFKNLYSSWTLNKRSCASALKQVAQNYPHYSVHDELHSKNVISNMEQILGERRIQKLSPTDTWMLLQLAYLHDFGMLLLYDNIEKEWDSLDFQEYLQECLDSHNPSVKKAAEYLHDLKDNLAKDDFEKTWPLHIRRYTTYLIAGYYRGKHADLTNQYIADRLAKWGVDLSHNGLIHPRLIKLLGQLSLLHTRNQEDVLKLDYISNGYAADYIHPRFLAEMLRLGDLLDADNSRFEPAAELVTGELPQDSAGHKGKHEATVHLLITPEQIEYRADCPNHAVYRETRVFLDWLENELTFAAINWLNMIPKELGGTAPRLTKKELLLNGKPDIDNTSDLRFGISQEKAFEIIEGSGIYDDKMVFLRELIQNAEDASKIQLWRDLQKRPDLYLRESADRGDLSHIQPYDLRPEAFDSYKITVDMKKEPENMFRIRVIDRGTGMNVSAVKQMCRVGTSYHQDKARRREIEAMPAWLRPTAGFGIGLQSVFLVTPTFTMYSRTGEKAIKISVESRKKEGYVQVEEEDTWKEQGTCVEVVLKLFLINDLPGNSPDPFGEDSENADRIYKDFCDTIKDNVGPSCFPMEITQDGLLIEDFRNELWSDFQWEDCQRKGPFLIRQAMYKGIWVWDTETYTMFYLGAHVSTIHTRIAVKGKAVRLPYSFDRAFVTIEQNFQCCIDFWGLDAKEYLALNREEFQHSKIDEITRQFRVMVQVAVDFLLDQDNLPPWIMEKEDAPSPDGFSAIWIIADTNQRKRMLASPEKYLHPMTSKLRVLQWTEDGSYQESTVPMGAVLKNYGEYHFAGLWEGWRISPGIHGYWLTKQTICDICDSMQDELEQKSIVLDASPIMQIPDISIKKIRCSLEWGSVCLYALKSAPLGYCEMGEETRAAFLKYMYYGLALNEKQGIIPFRYGILAMEGYSILGLTFDRTLVENIPSIYQQSAHLHNTYIISPVMAGDERVKDCSKQEFITQITQSSSFDRIADYVLENRADPAPCTKEDIVEAYKRLLSEYYDVMHEEDAGENEGAAEPR